MYVGLTVVILNLLLLICKFDIHKKVVPLKETNKVEETKKVVPFEENCCSHSGFGAKHNRLLHTIQGYEDFDTACCTCRSNESNLQC